MLQRIFLSLCVLFFHCGKRSASAVGACVERDYSVVSGQAVGAGIVCVCNSTYCDSVPAVEPLSSKEAVVFTSSESGDRFRRQTSKWSPTLRGPTLKEELADLNIVLNPGIPFQSILGFGGAFTDAAGININSLPSSAQKFLLESYFGDTGIRYSVGRVPMGSCDFSTREYSYDDTKGDLNLTHFNLTTEDHKFKIPYIKIAEGLRDGGVKLFGSPWSAPGWMKTNGRMNGNGTIIGQPGQPYYKAWGQYFVRFLKEYGENNITFWGLTAQNEPTTGFVYNYSFQTTGFTAETQRDFIKLDLGPALRSAGYRNVNLMILDDQRVMLPQWADTVLNDAEAREYVSGIGVHWYYDGIVGGSVLSETVRKHPGAFILGTEACEGWAPWQKRGPILGSWDRAESYAHDIIDDLNHGVVGWTDWNLALNLEGGPNWVKNFVDSPIIVNKTAREFYKQPMFYAIGHFSAFVPPGSKRVQLKLEDGSAMVSAIGFSTPKLERVVVLLNRGSKSVSLTIRELGITNRILKVNLKQKSVQTILWKKA